MYQIFLTRLAHNEEAWQQNCDRGRQFPHQEQVGYSAGAPLVELCQAVGRFAQEAERAKQIVESGILGDIVSARSRIGEVGLGEIGCPADMVAGYRSAASGTLGIAG